MSMKIKKNLCRFFRGVWGSLLCTVALFASCRDDLEAPILSGEGIHFSVSEDSDWRITRGSASRMEEAPSLQDSLLEVLPLQTTDGGHGLYLHAFLTEKASAVCTDGKEAVTRSAPVETATFYDSFGVLASVYTGTWNEAACLPDYMYNVKVTKASGWTTSYRWPGGGRHIRFFAYAPYNGQGIVLSDKTKTGIPTVAYTVPAAVADQKDLLVAASAAMAGNTSSTAPLTFVHALTAVRFTTGDDMLAGRITKITLKGVYGSGMHTMGSDSWGAYGMKRDFEQTLSAVADGSADQEITPVAATFMMLPQTLPQGASIEVVYTDDLTSTQRTLTASIAGKKWPMGKTVTYRISTTSIVVTPTFSVTAPADFSYIGGSKNYSVTSYAVVSRPGDATQTVPVAWMAEFVEDDGSGGYNVIVRPDWLANFTASGSGGTSPSTFAAEIAAQQGITSNPHNDVLQAAPAVSGTYDLSTVGGTTAMQTANCYLVNAPGTYSLPLVYGNAIDYAKYPANGKNTSAYVSNSSGTNVLQIFVNHLNAAITDPYIYNNANCAPRDAVLVWQDEQNLVTNVRLAPDGHNLIFDVSQATIKQGNAIVAVRDADNRIMWSWHIWVTDYRLGDDIKTVFSKNNKSYRMMPVNVGWCDAETTTYDARSVKVRFTQAETRVTQVITLTQIAHTSQKLGNQPYFQFGRKDPMLAGFGNRSSSQNKHCYSEHYPFDHTGGGGASIGGAIQNPHRFYRDKRLVEADPDDWCSSSYTNLWGDVPVSGSLFSDAMFYKTIYDPSPVGYRLPSSGAFTGTTYSGNVADKNNLGNNFFRAVNSRYASASDNYETRFVANAGGDFYCRKMPYANQWNAAGGTIFFPASGHRNNIRGKIGNFGMFGFYWSATPQSQKAAGAFYCNRVNVSPILRYGRANGFAVRPVQE